jgi:hypothetical protein
MRGGVAVTDCCRRCPYRYGQRAAVITQSHHRCRAAVGSSRAAVEGKAA